MFLGQLGKKEIKREYEVRIIFLLMKEVFHIIYFNNGINKKGKDITGKDPVLIDFIKMLVRFDRYDKNIAEVLDRITSLWFNVYGNIRDTSIDKDKTLTIINRINNLLNDIANNEYDLTSLTPDTVNSLITDEIEQETDEIEQETDEIEQETGEIKQETIETTEQIERKKNGDLFGRYYVYNNDILDFGDFEEIEYKDYTYKVPKLYAGISTFRKLYTPFIIERHRLKLNELEARIQEALKQREATKDKNNKKIIQTRINELRAKVKSEKVIIGGNWTSMPTDLKKIVNEEIQSAFDENRIEIKVEGYHKKFINTKIDLDLRTKMINLLELQAFDSGAFEFYPTPQSVITKMINLATGIDNSNNIILEPSAGRGDILDQLIQSLNEIKRENLFAIEFNDKFRQLLLLKGYKILAENLLTQNTELEGEINFDYILMNPPYENGISITHVYTAFTLLNPEEGKLIAMVPASNVSESAKDYDYIKFRDFVDQHKPTNQTNNIVELKDVMLKEAEKKADVETVLIKLQRNGINDHPFKEREKIYRVKIRIGEYFIDTQLPDKNIFKIIEINNKHIRALNIEMGVIKTFPRFKYKVRYIDEETEEINFTYENSPVMPDNYQILTEEELKYAKEKEKNSDVGNDDKKRGGLPDLQRQYVCNRDTGDTSGACNYPERIVKDKRPREPQRFIIAREELTREPGYRRFPDEFTKYINAKSGFRIYDHVVFGINKAIYSLEEFHSFLLADGTGVGKTTQQLITAYYFLKTYKRPVLIVTHNDTVIKDAFFKDAKKIGISKYLKRVELINDKKTLNITNSKKIYLMKYNDFSQLFSSTNTLPEKIEYEDYQKGFGAEIKRYRAKVSKIVQEYSLIINSDPEHSKELREKMREKIADIEVDYDIKEKSDRLSKLEIDYMTAQKDVLSDIGSKLELIIFDECHNLRNFMGFDSPTQGTLLAYRSMMLADGSVKNDGRIFYASATPIDQPQHLLYLRYSNMFKDEQHFIRAMRSFGFEYSPTIKSMEGQILVPGKWHIGGKVDIDLKLRYIQNLFDDLTDDGCMLTREIALNNYDVSMYFIKKEIHPAVQDTIKNIESKIEEIKKKLKSSKSLDAEGKYLLQIGNAKMEMQRLVEAYKIEAIEDITEKELNEGRNVVIFIALQQEGEAINELSFYARPSTMNLLRERLEAKYGHNCIAIIDGSVSKKKRNEEINDFQANCKRILITTTGTGGTGLSLDDQTGEAPRTLICVTAPYTSFEAVQMLGRIERANTKTRTKAYFLFYKDLPIEKWLARIIAIKLKTLQASVNTTIGDFDLFSKMEDNDNKIQEWASQKKVKGKKYYYHSLFDVPKIDCNLLPKPRDLIITQPTRDDLKNSGFVSYLLPEIKIRSTKSSVLKEFAKTYSNLFYAYFDVEKRIFVPDLNTDIATYNPQKEDAMDYARWYYENDRYKGLSLNFNFSKLLRNYYSLKSDEKKDVFRVIKNKLLNTILPEQISDMTKQDIVYNIGDKVRLLIASIEADKVVGDIGKITNTRKIILAEKKLGGQELTEYVYKIEFEDGNILNRAYAGQFELVDNEISNNDEIYYYDYFKVFNNNRHIFDELFGIKDEVNDILYPIKTKIVTGKLSYNLDNNDEQYNADINKVIIFYLPFKIGNTIIQKLPDSKSINGNTPDVFKDVNCEIRIQYGIIQSLYDPDSYNDRPHILACLNSPINRYIREGNYYTEQEIRMFAPIIDIYTGDIDESYVHRSEISSYLTNIANSFLQKLDELAQKDKDANTFIKVRRINSFDNGYNNIYKLEKLAFNFDKDNLEKFTELMNLYSIVDKKIFKIVANYIKEAMDTTIKQEEFPVIRDIFNIISYNNYKDYLVKNNNDEQSITKTEDNNNEQSITKTEDNNDEQSITKTEDNNDEQSITKTEGTLEELLPYMLKFNPKEVYIRYFGCENEDEFKELLKSKKQFLINDITDIIKRAYKMNLLSTLLEDYEKYYQNFSDEQQ